MSAAWPAHKVRDLIALGRIGESWSAIGRALDVKPPNAASAWGFYAREEDRTARNASLSDEQKRSQKAYFAQRGIPIPEPAPEPEPERYYEDDPRAVAECRIPRYVPRRSADLNSGYGCSAGWAAQ